MKIKPVRCVLHPRYKLSSEQKASAISEYISGASSIKIAAKYGIRPGSFRELLTRRGLTRTVAQAHRLNAIPCNHHAFDSITPKSAYWAGFLMADGCVSDAGQVVLSIAECDIEHVKAFKTFLGAGNVISIQEKSGFGKHRQRTVTLSIRSPGIALKLSRLGVTPRKTFTAIASGDVAMSLDFWRGVIDGDGSIGLYDRGDGKIVPLIQLCGASSKLIQQYIDFLKSSTTAVRKMGISRGTGVYRTSNGGATAISVIRLLYENATIALHRKNIIAQGIISKSNENPLWISRNAPRRPMSEVTKKRIGDKARGRIVSESTRKKMSNSRTGRKNTPETIERMRESARRRQPRL